MRRMLLIVICGLTASVAWGSGDFERANSDYLLVADNAAADLDYATGFTVCAWAKFDATAGTGSNCVFQITDSGATTFATVLMTKGETPSMAMYAPSTMATHSATPSTEWTHLAIVGHQDGSTEYATYYINGSSTQKSNASGSALSAAYFYIGRNKVGNVYMDGLIAEVAVYQNALNGTQITALQTTAPSEVGSPAIYLPLSYHATEMIADLDVTNHGVSFNTEDHPIESAMAPEAVTMVWPTAGGAVNHKTYIVWTKTPPDSALDQTFDVFCDTSNPPTTLIGDDLSVLYQQTGALVDGTTYYCRVDATAGTETKAGTVVTFTCEDPTGDVYYVGPSATGYEDGSSPDDLMAWSSVAAGTTAADTIRLIGPDATIYANYEGEYTEWPDRIYEAQSVIEYGITRNLQDWRRIGRFIDGSYWVVGPAIIMSYSPARTTMDAAVVNGMMVNPSGTDTGMDGRGVSYPGNYDATLDHGDELPYMVNTYPSSILNEDAIDSGDTEWQSGGLYGARSASVLTVVETALANNIWFRPSYRAYSGRAVEHQWSDVHASRIPQMDLNCGYTLQPTTQDDDRGGTGGGIAGGWTAIERIVSRPAIQLGNGWTNSRYIPAYHQASSYAGYLSMEQSVAYLALFDSDLGTLTGAKKRLLIGCIQRGIDYSGVYLEGDNETWFSADGGSTNGSYWPILFAGIMLNDEDLYDIGLDTNQDKDDPWNYSPYFSVSENDQCFQITASGETSWAEGPPWLVTAIPSATDNTGTCSVTHNSTTVQFQVGESWSWAKSIAAFSAYDGTHTQVDTTAAHGFANQSYVRICGTTNYNSTASHQITVIDADSFYYEKTYVADDAAGVVYACHAYGPLQFVTTTVGATTTCADNSLTAVGARAYNVAAVTLGSPYSVTLATAYGGETDEDATFAIAQLVCLGEQFSATHFHDYTEFDSSWLGRYWWTEKPTMDWRITGAVYDEAGYQSISTCSVAGMVLCADLMQREGAYAAVTKWNSPQTFGYYDWFHASEIAWSGYGNDWVETVFGNEWQWPVSSGGTIVTPSVFKSPIFGGIVR